MISNSIGAVLLVSVITLMVILAKKLDRLFSDIMDEKNNRVSSKVTVIS